MAVTEVVVDGVVFPPVARPPGSACSHFLGGAGVRGLEIGGNFIKFTAIGVYLEDAAVSALASKWAGKTADELAPDAAFFRDVVTGDFEKFTRVTMILPLTGEQYADKVTENCVAYWKAAGVYTDAEAAAVEKFKEVFKPETFPPGASILFAHSPAGVLTVTFSKDSSVPAAGGVAIENKPLCQAVLESIIGEHGVSPAAKLSLAARVSELLTKEAAAAAEADAPQAELLTKEAAAAPRAEHLTEEAVAANDAPPQAEPLTKEAAAAAVAPQAEPLTEGAAAAADAPQAERLTEEVAAAADAPRAEPLAKEAAVAADALQAEGLTMEAAAAPAEPVSVTT